MKKIALVLVLFALLAAGAFAQKIYLDSHLMVSPNYSIAGAVAAPSVGIGIDVGPVDILANLFFNYRQFKTSGNPDSTETDSLFGLCPGVAFKVPVSGNLSLMFPIYLKILFVNSETKANNTSSKNDHVGFGVDAGARAYYAIGGNWSVYAGVLTEVFASYGEGGRDKTSALLILDSGAIDLGFKYSFN